MSEILHRYLPQLQPLVQMKTKRRSTLMTTDAEGNTVTYSVNNNAFTIGSTNGVLAFVNPPNYEAQSTYQIQITATDGVMSAYQDVTVDIDVNDAPSFTSSATFTAIENQTAIGAVTATDADGDALTYNISGSEININSSSGVLTFATEPDYETKSSYTATVTVTDDSADVTQDITVLINDLNDRVPLFTSSASFTVNENETAIGTVTATDADDDTITFSISGSEMNINSSTGVLTFSLSTRL